MAEPQPKPRPEAPKPFLSAEQVGEVQALKPQSSGEDTLKPESEVLCINRGRETYTDMFDSRTYVIEPGYFTVAYGAALHFQARAVVPGSRNPETGFQASFIAIIGTVNPKTNGLEVKRTIDEPVQWQPFTDEECREYNHAVEAIDRAAMLDPIDPNVQIVPTLGQANEDAKARAQSRLKGGPGTGARRPTQISGPGTAALQPGQMGVVGEDERGLPNDQLRQPATLGKAGDNEAIRQSRVDAEAAARGKDRL